MVNLSQKEAVYNAVKSYLHECNRYHEDGDQVELSSEDRRIIVDMLVLALQAGEIDMSSEAKVKHNSTEKIRNYTTGLLSNWLRKDSRLNGGKQYSAKHPGSRFGQDDEIVKTLKAIKKLLTQSTDIHRVELEIAKRLEVLQLQRERERAINKNLIPPHLQHLVRR